MFMNSRGRVDPDVFANADFNSIHLAIQSHAVLSGWLFGYSMLLIGQKTAATYGRLTIWEDDAYAVQTSSWGIGFQPGDGLLIMEIQQRKLEFLRTCAELILQDLPLDDNSISTQPKLPAFSKETRGCAEDTDWPSLTKEISEAPYRVPDQFDIKRLQSYIRAKRDEAEDHVWFLREDPSYFKNTVLDCSDHRLEQISCVKGTPHPDLRTSRFWDRVLVSVVHDAYANFLNWDVLHQYVDELSALRELNATQISRESPLPKVYEKALTHFSRCLEVLTRMSIYHFRRASPSSPPLRHIYAREFQDPNSKEVTIGSRTRNKKEYFVLVLEQLSFEDRIALFGLENLTDEVERRMRTSSSNRELVSPCVARALSDLSLLGEIRRQIGLLRAEASMAQAVSPEELETEYFKRTKLLSQVHHTLHVDKHYSKAGTPLSKFNYPSSKRRNASVTYSLQEAERNLDTFWKEVDERFLKQDGKDLHTLLAGMLSHRNIRRTPDWATVDDKVEIQDQITGNIDAKAALLELGTNTEKTIAPQILPAPFEKVKTRGTAVQPEVFQEQLGKDFSSPPTKFTVSKRGFKVFSTLFHSPGREDPPGELPWSEFLSAMASVGFSIRKLNGSAWVFEPMTDLFRRSIIFHEPHPTNKIPFQVARRYGRRLERAYGWTIATFSRS